MKYKDIIIKISKYFISKFSIFFLIFFSIIYGRWLSIIYPIPLNPDEAQAAANAIRVKMDGFNWDSLDGTTVGPLNSVVLAWPYLFGCDVTFSTIRLTAAVLLCFLSIFLFLALEKMAGKLIAALLIIPLVIFYSLTQTPDFLHYSSELFSLFLLFLANLIITKISIKEATKENFFYHFLFIGLILGAIPFAKIQAAPVAVVIGGYSLFLILSRDDEIKLRNFFALLCGSITPSFLILTPLAIRGNFHDFWYSYIVWASLYTGAGNFSIIYIISMVNIDPLLKNIFYLYFVIIIFLSLRLFALAFKEKIKIFNKNLIYGIILALVSSLVVLIPGNPFLHYFMFLPPALIFLCASLFHIKKPRRIIFSSCYIILFAFFLSLFINDIGGRENFKKFRQTYKAPIKQEFYFKNSRLFSWLSLPSEYILIWGWMPQWYVLSDLSPATRESHTLSQIIPTDLSGYFRSRFLNDIQKSNPDIIIDAVHGDSFVFNDSSKFSPEMTDPNFANFMNKNYFYMKPWAESLRCPKIYIKNKYKEFIENRFVLPASVVASDTYNGNNSIHSASNLFDLSITEDSCIDYWLLPDDKLGNLKINFQKREKIKSILILNTRNSKHLDRATNTIRITMNYANSEFENQEISLHPYPYWTSVNFKDPVDAESITIDILSFFGKGAGLNEIKIIRAQ